MSQPLLSILIPTVFERQESFNKLRAFINYQINEYDLNGQVEVLHLVDNKEMTIGEKRNKLYQMANGIYSWQIDDDDNIHHEALPLIIDELKAEDCDCVGYKELCIFDGKRVESSNFSIKYGGWADNVDGFNHVRTPFFKTPIKTRLCLQVPAPHTRFGEDHEFAMAIYPLLQKENYIDEFVYLYQYNSTPFNKRYGIA
jgi:hypothetical protein